jgi:hypothetical protein
MTSTDLADPVLSINPSGIVSVVKFNVELRVVLAEAAPTKGCSPLRSGKFGWDDLTLENRAHRFRDIFGRVTSRSLHVDYAR